MTTRISLAMTLNLLKPLNPLKHVAESCFQPQPVCALSSSTKKTAPKSSLSILRWAKKKIDVPIIAIGGMNNLNYKKIFHGPAKKSEVPT